MLALFTAGGTCFEHFKNYTFIRVRHKKIWTDFHSGICQQILLHLFKYRHLLFSANNYAHTFHFYFRTLFNRVAIFLRKYCKLTKDLFKNNARVFTPNKRC